MKLATFWNGHADGQLYVVSHDLQRCLPAEILTLQGALEGWDRELPSLLTLAERLDQGEGGSVDELRVMAPLPRAWQWLDGSAFQSHGDLMAQAFGMEKMPFDQRPLMYQGMSDRFLAPYETAFFPSEERALISRANLG